MMKDMAEINVHTRSASNVHGFEVAGFDDAHSDGVGCWVVAQGHQQIPSTSLKISYKTTVAANCSLYHLFINIFLLYIRFLLCIFVSSSSFLFCFPSTCQSLHIPSHRLSHQYAATSPRGASQQPRITSPILSHFLFCFPPYIHCHHYMVSAPSRKSACWPGPVC